MVDYGIVDAYGLIKADPGDRIFPGEKCVIEVYDDLVLRVAHGGFTVGQSQEVFRWPVDVSELPSGSVVEVEYFDSDCTYTAVVIGGELHLTSDGRKIGDEFATVKQVYYRHG